MRDGKRDIIFVCGMHRSGTSVLTKSLSLCGLQLPISAGVKGDDNPHGFFEPSSIVDIHESILNKFGRSWSTTILDSYATDSITEQSSVIERLRKALIKEFPHEQPLVLKDPRLCLLLPLWREFVKELGVHDFYVLPFRHPIDVSNSLTTRNNFTTGQSCLVWLRYVLDSELNTRGCTRTFLEFPKWPANSNESIKKVECDLGIELLKHTSLEDIDGAFDDSLVHHQCVGRKPESGTFEQLAVEAHDALKLLTLDPNDPIAIDKLDDIRATFNSCTSAFAGVLNTCIAHTSAEHQLAESKRLKKLKHKNDQQVKLLDSQLRVLDSQLRESQILLRNERYTVWRPMYRNVYKFAGKILKQVVPQRVFHLIKRYVPNADGISSRLSIQHVTKRTGNPVDMSELKCIFETPGSTAKPDIFIFSIIPWDFRFQRPQQLATKLSESGRRVFYIEMDFASPVTEVRQVDDSLCIVRLPIHESNIEPYSGEVGRYTAKKYIDSLYQLCDAVSATAHKQVVIQHPFWWQIVKHLSPEFEIVYDCMDDISGFANTNERVLMLEDELVQKCDKLIVSSQKLFDTYKTKRSPNLVRNAANVEHFTVQSELHTELELQNQDHNDSIKAGYVGAIDTWFDVQLLMQCAKESPDIEFHLCGAVTARGPNALDSLSNVTMYGEVPYSSVPNFVEQMDVMLIPFKILPIIQACDPVKFYEHSAKGKPTVTTPLPELDRVSHLTFVASDAESFAEMIRSAKVKAEDPSYKNSLIEFAKENDWEHRCEEFLAVCSDYKKVSIVVLSYGDPDLTVNTLYSLYQCGAAYPNQEIIIVDNGSPEESLNKIREFASSLPQARLIEAGENLGFAKGNNLGINESTGDYILLLNNDTYVSPGSIYALVRHLEIHPHVGVVGPLTNNIGNEAKIFTDYTTMEEMLSVARQSTLGYRGVHTAIPVVAYFAAMFRAADVDTFGVLSEEYGRGMFEDDDHCQQIKSNGFSCVLAEDAFIHHHLSATFSKVKEDERSELFERNKQIFESKWGHWKMHEYRDHRPESSIGDWRLV